MFLDTDTGAYGVSGVAQGSAIARHVDSAAHMAEVGVTTGDGVHAPGAPFCGRSGLNPAPNPGEEGYETLTLSCNSSPGDSIAKIDVSPEHCPLCSNHANVRSVATACMCVKLASCYIFTLASTPACPRSLRNGVSLEAVLPAPPGLPATPVGTRRPPRPTRASSASASPHVCSTHAPRWATPAPISTRVSSFVRAARAAWAKLWSSEAAHRLHHPHHPRRKVQRRLGKGWRSSSTLYQSRSARKLWLSWSMMCTTLGTLVVPVKVETTKAPLVHARQRWVALVHT